MSTSYSSDQTTLLMDTIGSDNLVATYKFGTEGLEVYVPGSGILFKEGIVFNLAGTSGSVTVTITGA
jgi:hypothetical protein